MTIDPSQTQPPIIPGPPPQQQQPYTLAAVMPGPPPKRGVHPLSIVLAVVGGVALLCGGIISIGSLASTSAAGKPSPSAVYVYVTGPAAPAQAAPTTAPAPATTQPPPPPPGPPTMSGGGVLLVPSEAKPGTWRTTVPDGEHCYWARLKGTSGAFEDIITNGNANPGERVTVTIKSTDKAFEFSPGCGTWTKIG